MRPAKRLLAALLACLLLGGCAAQTAPAASASPVGLDALTEDTVLFYPQETLKEKQGVLVPLSAVEGAQAAFPRTHRYDDHFAAPELARLLPLLDYCFNEGYCGFSVSSALLDADSVTPEQFQLLKFLYPIDSCSIRGSSRSFSDTAALPCATFWCDCSRDATMDCFVEGLASARELAAQCPDGLGQADTALWLFMQLNARVEYGDLDSYYRKHGHQLYDALVEGSTVCTGYSDALYYLFQLRGIDCLCVTGLCMSPRVPGTEADHQWNLAELDGVWYCFDPTWADDTTFAGAQGCFGLSSEALYLVGGHRLSGACQNNPLLPVCERCFSPASVWNDSPEGALRSWLWYTAIAAQQPIYLLVAAGLGSREFAASQPDADGWVTLPLDYEAFRAWSAAYMTDECLAQLAPYREDHGKLRVHAVSASGVGYRIDAVTENADGSYTAALRTEDGGKAAASFTVEQTNGRFRIASAAISAG